MAEKKFPPFDPATTTRPISELLTYYVIVSALTVVGFPFLILPLYFRYYTMKYRFDDKGVSMSWGILFRREVYLTYRRIQDIHVTRNFLQRWMHLANVGVQTASGSAGAEMTLEGIPDPEGLRDYLYAKMRGVRDDTEGESATNGDGDEALVLLREIRDGIRALKGERS